MPTGDCSNNLDPSDRSFPKRSSSFWKWKRNKRKWRSKSFPADFLSISCNATKNWKQKTAVCSSRRFNAHPRMCLPLLSRKFDLLMPPLQSTSFPHSKKFPPRFLYRIATVPQRTVFSMRQEKSTRLEQPRLFLRQSYEFPADPRSL